ncbi:MAG: TonB-dependent receptor [Planctomycetota bacterium]
MIPRHLSVWLLIATLIVECGLASAQTTPDLSKTGALLDVIDAAEIVVESGADEKIRLDNPSRFIDVIELNRASERLVTLTDVLESSAGVQVKRYGGLGAFATVAIRGSSANQVGVHIDGIPIGTAGDQTVNIETLPLESFERLDIYRGQSPVSFGAGAIGGIVNLITRDAKAQRRTAVSASYGSFNTARLGATLQNAWDSHSLFLNYGWEKTDGNFPLRTDNGTPLNSDDDYDTVRKNNAHSSHSGLIKYDYGSDAFELTLVEDGYYKTTGLPGLDYDPSLHTSLRTARSITRASVRPTIRSARFSAIEASGDIMVQDERYRDENDELGLGSQNISYQTRSGGLKLSGEAILPYQRVRASVDIRGESSRSVYHSAGPDSTGPLQSRRLYLAGIEDEWLFADETVSLLPAIRFQRIDNRFDSDPFYPYSGATAANAKTHQTVSPSLGLNWRLSDELDVKANIGQYYRPPAFYELFGDRGGIVGNGLLEPETSINWDIGLRAAIETGGWFRRATMELAYFGSDADDLILLVQNSQDTARAENISSAWINGIEATVEAHGSDWLTLTGNVTWQDARDSSDIAYSTGKQLPGRSEWEASARMDIQPTPFIRLFGELTYQSGAYWDRQNIVAVDSRAILNAGMTRKLPVFGVETTLTFEVKNITDNRLTDVARYPLPGRSWFITLVSAF